MITRYCTQVVAVLSLHTTAGPSTRVVDRGRALVPCWVKERAIIFSWKAAGIAGAETFAEVHVSGISFADASGFGTELLYYTLVFR